MEFGEVQVKPWQRNQVSDWSDCWCEYVFGARAQIGWESESPLLFLLESANWLLQVHQKGSERNISLIAAL